MKNWNIGTNNFHKTASVFLEEGPLWAFWGRELTWIFCDFIPPIPFPKIGKIVDDEGEEYNWNQWYGDLKSWWCLNVDQRLYFWFNKFVEVKDVKIKYYTAVRLKREVGK